MAAALNGMAVSKIRPFGGTFFNFSDYMRPSIRLAALMEIPTIYVFTHDSIGLGEDGPTHQPIEQLASLRAMPGLMLMRPADANEVVEAWKVIMQLQHEPAALVLKPAGRAHLRPHRNTAAASGVAKGAYILADAADGKPEVILMGTGSEVSLCVSAYEQLKTEGIKARVVSMPSWNLFEHQSDEYKAKVLPPEVKARVAVEQAATFGWSQYVGPTGTVIGMRTIRSLGSDQGFAEEVRVHHRERSRGGPKSNWKTDQRQSSVVGRQENRQVLRTEDAMTDDMKRGLYAASRSS